MPKRETDEDGSNRLREMYHTQGRRIGGGR
jgi:hypothetical protein